MRKLNLFFLLAVLVLTSCSKEVIDENSETALEPQISAFKDDITEIAFPDQKGKVMDVYYTGMRIPVENVNGKYIYQGDIIIPKGSAYKSPVKLVYEQGEIPDAQARSVGRTSNYWTDNTVYYEIDGSLPNQTRVFDAIKHWEANTNLDFVKRSGQSNYIYFTPGSGCSSYVGMVGGKQNITLADACSTGNTIHEIGHAIGLWHEQSRVDRDNHITVHFDNIQSGREYNFETYVEGGYDGNEFTTNLDFGSIMMYSPYSFSKNGEPTITKKDGSLYSVQRSALSNGDVQGVNSMYPSSSTTEPSYVNGEYYTLYGLTVLYYYGNFYYKHSLYGWMKVEYVNGYWRYM